MNTTTLNMTTLDGGVIIKKGEGGGSTPPSGGSGESGSNVEYWDITAAPDGLYEIAQFATLLKYTRSGTMYIDSIYRLSRSGITPIGVAIDTSLEHLNNATIKTVGEVFKEFGFPSFDTIGWVRLTKEQFYSLD